MSADPKSLALTAITTTKTNNLKTTTYTSTSNSSLNQTPDSINNNSSNISQQNYNNNNDNRGGGAGGGAGGGGEGGFVSTTRRLRTTPLKTFRSTDEFVAGWVAAFINTTALFPINKLIFRQMAGGHKTLFAADQMKEEGLRYLYRGILPPLVQKMVTVSIMFGSFGHYRDWADRKFTDNPPIANLALAAILTGTTEAVLTPLERVQMLLQDRSFHKNYKNTLDALVKLRLFGYTEYYRGLSCVLMRNGPSNILFFGLRDEIKELLRTWRLQAKQQQQQISQLQNNNNNNNNSTELLSDHDVTFHNNSNHSHQPARTNRSDEYKSMKSPIDRIVNNFDNGSGDSNNEKDITRKTTMTHQTAITKESKADDSILHDFLAGAILGACISTLFYPLSVVRTRMQTRAPGTEFLSIVKAFKDVYSERDKKFSRLFHGCSINILRQFVSWGVINCSYEFVLDLLHNSDSIKFP